MTLDDSAQEHPGRTMAQRVTQAGLPALIGTAEEIAAAEPIRSRLLMAADERLSQLRSDRNEYAAHTVEAIPTPAVMPGQVIMSETALRHLRHQVSAAWWLGHQHSDLAELLEE